MAKTADKKSSRILTFDLLRGYFLVAIVLDHLNLFPNGLDWWSARGNLFVTTAEGFFLISGIVLGIVRGSKLIGEPFRHVATLLIKRGVQLYITSIILVFLFTLIAWWFFMDSPGLKNGVLPPTTDIFDLLWRIVTLQYFYGWADYLRLYALFLFVSPLAMWLLRKGWWYLLLIGNVLVWLLFPTDPTLPDTTQELLQPLTWQLIFFGGMTIGFYWKQITEWWHSRPTRQRTIAIWSVLSLAVVTLLINLLITFGTRYVDLHAIGITPDTHYQFYVEFFDKERLSIFRLSLFFVWFWAAFYLFKRFETVIMLWLGWLLLPYGTNSLYVYTVHAFFIFFVHLFVQTGNVVSNFIISVGVVLLIRLMIQYKVLMNVIPR